MFEEMPLLDKLIAYERLEGIVVDTMEIRLKSHEAIDKIFFCSLFNNKILINESKINNGFRYVISINIFEKFIFKDYVLFVGKLNLMFSKLHLEVETLGLIL